MSTRLEHDFLGELEIPADTYYGVQTCRALENFKISGTAISDTPELIDALACVKKAAARANMELGVLPADIGEAICKACDEIIAGKLHDQFPIDCLQGGAGTSTNMNANEVIANRALFSLQLKVFLCWDHEVKYSCECVLQCAGRFCGCRISDPRRAAEH